MGATSVKDLIGDLSEKNNHRALGLGESKYVRECIYKPTIPSYLKLEGNTKQALYTRTGSKICTGYTRIVIGDYGAYVEIPQSYLVKENVKRNSGIDDVEAQRKYATSPQAWFTVKDGSNINIHMQCIAVTYADFVKEHFYASVFDVCVIRKLETVGDILSAKEDFICHQVNCKGIFANGITDSITKKWPHVKTEYEDFCNKAANQLALFGAYQIVPISDTQSVVNIFSQNGFGRDKKTVYTSYPILAEALKDLKEKYPDKSFAFPTTYGCGAANGDPEIIHGIISCCLDGLDVAIYKAPPKDLQYEAIQDNTPATADDEAPLKAELGIDILDGNSPLMDDPILSQEVTDLMSAPNSVISVDRKPSAGGASQIIISITSEAPQHCSFGEIIKDKTSFIEPDIEPVDRFANAPKKQPTPPPAPTPIKKPEPVDVNKSKQEKDHGFFKKAKPVQKEPENTKPKVLRSF